MSARCSTEVHGDDVQRDVRQHVLHLLGHLGNPVILGTQTLDHEAEAHGARSDTLSEEEETPSPEPNKTNIQLHAYVGRILC